MTTERIPVKSISCDNNVFNIKRGKIICLRKEGSVSNGGDYFRIDAIAGEGASCVCYDATLLGEGKKGRLKEFYPMKSFRADAGFSLKRTECNYITATEDTKETFLTEREDFLAAYRLLREVMQKNRNNADFTSFIPDFSIYYACDAEGNFIDGSSAYIWSEHENLIVFEKYIQNVHKHPGTHPEHNLFTILKTVLTLTECVKILHDNGLLHLDIKPGNFGIPKRKDKLLTDFVTLFDVNSIYSLKKKPLVEYGTKGFCAPELGTGYADNTSDIYSIGCTLFAALVTSDELGYFGYSNDYYAQIPSLIESSKIINASETNSNVFLKNDLVYILKKCLKVSKTQRYQSCTELIADLESALAFLYPAEINSRLPVGKRMVLSEKEFDRKQGVGAYLTFMYHLYKKPLFEFVPLEGDTLDVLIIGFGNYGQRFLDCCLQMGQMIGKRLNVKVVSNDRAKGKRDKDIYLSARPALKGFFNIDDHTCNDAYGTITFQTREFVRDSLKKNKEIASEIVTEHNQAQYVFVALGDDTLNKGVAKAICSLSDGESGRSVNFAFDGEHISGKVYGNPVYMSDDIAKEPLYRDIERMAFNVHLVWKSGASAIELEKIRKDFKNPYNYNASFSNAVSLKYKLYSIGIAADDTNLAAWQFYKGMQGKLTQLKNDLVTAEHKRWVCEKICSGWTCNQNLNSCVFGETNDKKAKKHICLVRSTAAAPLLGTEWTRDMWDIADAKSIEELDALDSVSIRLHQTYKAAADKMRRESTLLDTSMLQLKSIVKINSKVNIAFSEWYSCLVLIWNGNDNPARDYELLKDALDKSLNTLDDYSKNTARALIKLIDGRFRIILKSMLYTNYKNYDTALINHIPFILTNRRDIRLVIPLKCGSNTDIFANVAGATVVNPSHITYLVELNKSLGIECFKKAVQYILNYMKEKNLIAKLNFVITHPKDSALIQGLKKLQTELLGDANKRVHKVIVHQVADDFEVVRCMTDTLSSKIRFDAVERNDAPLSRLLVGAGFYEKFPNYQFDMNTQKFYSIVGCEFLRYAKAGQYLKISDMFASKNSKGYLDSPAAFYNDYEALWKRCYRRKEYVWKKMCKRLSDYHKVSDKIFNINVNVAKDKSSFEKYRFLVPAGAYEVVLNLISIMIEMNIFDKKSEIYYYTTDSCEVIIYAPKAIEAEIKKFMADQYVLNHPERVEFSHSTYSVMASFSRLKVKCCDLSDLGNNVEKVKSLLRMLEKDFAFITDYTESGENNELVSFTYATNRIKKLLTTEGNILEVYVYHKCLKSDLFDDVATGYEVNWDGTDSKNEFDILITKGFAGLLVEAKATEAISQDYYFKLSGLAKEFGTNCKSVLIADTVERDDEDNSVNEMQRSKGDKMDVITIFDPYEIDTIDVTLARLLNIKVSVDADKKAPTPKRTVCGIPAQSQEMDKSKETCDEFLAQKLEATGFLLPSYVSTLKKYGVITVADFLAQTEESFSQMKFKHGISLTSCFLDIQNKIRKKLEML